MNYTVFAALKEHIESGFVWVRNSSIKNRCFVRIKNNQNNKRIFTTAFSIDDNFLKSYKNGNTINLPSTNDIIVLNKWYRSKLGIDKTNCEIDLEIKKISFIRSLSIFHFHPQLEIRLSILLAIISVLLGIWSLFLTVYLM